MPKAKNRTARRNLADLYNRLQEVMPLLEEIIQSDEIRESGRPYAPPAAVFPENGPRYRFEKRGREAWAVLDGHDGGALLALTKYKKGAVSLVERLENYERRIAELTRSMPEPRKTAELRAFSLR